MASDSCGVYVLGDAFQAADLASQVGRRTRAKVISVGYRLAPEHPYPAAADDALAAYEALLQGGTAPSGIAFAGESAGGGLAIATLVNARDHGLPLPAAAFVMSPYADLTLAGATMQTKREADPLLSRENLQPRVTDYTAGQDAALGLISPIFADLSGLPPLIIQAGTHEVLLDDAIRPGYPTSSRPITRSSTKRPQRWTEPDSSCRHISRVQNASPPSERQNAGGVEQGHPFVFAVPAFGQAQGDVSSAVPGGAGGDIDQIAADGGAAGSGVGEAGQGPGGAQQVVRERGAGQARRRWPGRSPRSGREQLLLPGTLVLIRPAICGFLRPVRCSRQTCFLRGET